MYDPLEYLLRLKERLTPKEGGAVDFPGFAIYVEKILSQSEPLPQDWPICGTTGYDFLNRVNGIFVDERGHPTKPSGARPISRGCRTAHSSWPTATRKRAW